MALTEAVETLTGQRDPFHGAVTYADLVLKGWIEASEVPKDGGFVRHTPCSRRATQARIRRRTMIVFNSPIYGQAIARHAGVPWQSIRQFLCSGRRRRSLRRRRLHDYTEASMIDALGVVFTTAGSIATFSGSPSTTRSTRWACIASSVRCPPTTSGSQVQLAISVSRTVAIIEGVYKGDVACLVMRMERQECRLPADQAREDSCKRA